MLSAVVEIKVFLSISSSCAKRKNEVSIPCVKKTVITPAIEYQSTNGDDAAGPNARVTIGAIRKGKILTNTELKPYMAVCPNSFLYNFLAFLECKNNYKIWDLGF